MKSYLNILRSSALLITWLTVSDVNADWLDALTFDTAVSNSPTGPFASSARLWTQSVPAGFTPSSVDFFAAPFPGPFIDDKVHLPLASLSLTLGNYNSLFTPAPDVPFFIELTLPNQKPVLSGDFDFPNLLAGQNGFKFKGPSTLTLGNKKYDLTFEIISGDLPGAPPDPNATSAVIAAYEIWATIPLDDIAPAPEPASLVLAGIGGIGFIGFAWRGHRKRNGPFKA